MPDRDLRIIDRDELLATIRSHIDLLTDQGTQSALNGEVQACVNQMYAAGEIDSLHETIRYLTKHAPDAPRIAEPGELL